MYIYIYIYIYMYMGVFTGGGVISGVLTQSGRFFGRFQNFSWMSVGLIVKTWDPPIWDMENPEGKVSG